MSKEEITISPAHIEAHLGYYIKIDSIEAELSGINPVFKSDEEFCDCYRNNIGIPPTTQAKNQESTTT